MDKYTAVDSYSTMGGLAPIYGSTADLHMYALNRELGSAHAHGFECTNTKSTEEYVCTCLCTNASTHAYAKTQHGECKDKSAPLVAVITGKDFWSYTALRPFFFVCDTCASQAMIEQEVLAQENSVPRHK